VLTHPSPPTDWPHFLSEKIAAPAQFMHLVSGVLLLKRLREVNALIGRNMSTLVAAVPGIKTSTPAGGFYLYVDFNRQRQQLMALGFNTCVEFARHMLLVEHTAVLPGSALLLPEDDFSARCSYVDYDGEEALAGWRRNPPRTLDEQRAFVDKYCPLLVDGVANIGRFMEQVRQGKRPEHAA